MNKNLLKRVTNLKERKGKYRKRRRDCDDKWKTREAGHETTQCGETWPEKSA